MIFSITKYLIGSKGKRINRAKDQLEEIFTQNFNAFGFGIELVSIHESGMNLVEITEAVQNSSNMKAFNLHAKTKGLHPHPEGLENHSVVFDEKKRERSEFREHLASLYGVHEIVYPKPPSYGSTNLIPTEVFLKTYKRYHLDILAVSARRMGKIVYVNIVPRDENVVGRLISKHKSMTSMASDAINNRNEKITKLNLNIVQSRHKGNHRNDVLATIIQEAHQLIHTVKNTDLSITDSGENKLLITVSTEKEASSWKTQKSRKARSRICDQLREIIGNGYPVIIEIESFEDHWYDHEDHVDDDLGDDEITAEDGYYYKEPTDYDELGIAIESALRDGQKWR